MKKQSKASLKAAKRAGRNAAVKAEAKAHRAAVKAEAKVHRAAIKAEAKAHREAIKAEDLAHDDAVRQERRAHNEAMHAHSVALPEPELLDEHATTTNNASEADRLMENSAQDAYDAANESLDSARAAFADLDWTTHTREEWIAASARLRAAWAAVDAARLALNS
jgi:hypothetical protein